MEEKPNYYARNKKTRKEYQRRYYISNREKIIEKRKIERSDDPEKWAARSNYNKEYYKKNKDKILERRRLAYADKKKSVDLGKRAVEFMKKTLTKTGGGVNVEQFEKLDAIIRKNLRRPE